MKIAESLYDKVVDSVLGQLPPSQRICFKIDSVLTKCGHVLPTVITD